MKNIRNGQRRILFLVIALLFSVAGFSISSAASPYSEKCSTSHSISTNFLTNDNIYSSDSDKDKDSITTWSYSGEIECTAAESTEYSVSFDYEENDFSSNTDDDFTYSEFSFALDRALSAKDWIDIEASHGTTRTDNSGAALYEVSGDSTEWEITYGRQTSRKGSLEFTIGRDQTNYDILETSANISRSYELAYTYELPAFTYLEFSYTKKDVEYPNSFIYASETDSTGYTDFIETTNAREDERTAFAVSFSKTISIYPLKYLMLGVEQLENESNSTGFDWIDFDKLIDGYDDYDEFNYYLYYIQDLNPRTMFLFYYMFDKIEYPNYQLYDLVGDAYSLTGSLSTKMKYYYADIQYDLKDNLVLDLSYTINNYESSDPDFTYKQKMYNVGLTMDL